MTMEAIYTQVLLEALVRIILTILAIVVVGGFFFLLLPKDGKRWFTGKHPPKDRQP